MFKLHSILSLPSILPETPEEKLLHPRVLLALNSYKNLTISF